MSRNLIKYFTLFLLSFYIVTAQKLWAAKSYFISTEDNNSKVRLLASYQNKEGLDNKIVVGFHFKLKNNWTIYGQSDSSFTQPPKFDFSGSQNIDSKNYNVIWPKAKIVNEEILDEIISYPIYEQEVIIPVILKVIDKEKNSDIKVKLNYGLCKEICVPVTQEFSLSLKTIEFDKESLELSQKFIKKASSSSRKISMTLITAIIISFIGGLILNIMPCVLPVLSIKLLSILNHSKSSLKKIRIVYASTLTGILSTFLLFAAIISTLKILGGTIGWGVQFQNPYFLISLVVILSVFTANLIGIFEINSSSLLSNIVSKKIQKTENKNDIKNIVIKNFLSGVLAVILATPCSAPFVGTAISFAFTQDTLTIFTIFLFMGLGLAFPYILLILFPSAVKLLPKPGEWMITVKKLMAGFLVATIIWLIFILSNNIGFVSAMVVAVMSTLIFLFFAVCSKIKIKKIYEILIITLMTITIFLIPIKTSKYFSNKERTFNELWIKFDESKIEDLVNDNKVVIIDITADWCITCKVNKKIVLESAEITKYLKDPNIIGMRGDITRPNEGIMNFLASHDRFAIPFNMIYGPNAKEGILLSELLSKEDFVEAIEKAK